MKIAPGDRVEVMTRVIAGPILGVIVHSEWTIALVLSQVDPSAGDVLIKIGGHDPVRVPVRWLRWPKIENASPLPTKSLDVGAAGGDDAGEVMR